MQLRVSWGQNGQVAARVEGADAAALSAAVAKHIAAAKPPRAKLPTAPGGRAPAAQAVREAAEPAMPASDGREGLGTTARITRLLASAPVILFMKARALAIKQGHSRQRKQSL